MHSLARREIPKLEAPAGIQATRGAADRIFVHDLKYTEWQKLYDDAVSETDTGALAGRIRAAKVAIVSRMKEIRITSETRMEASALENALRSLIALGHETAKIKESQKVARQLSQLNPQND